MKVILLQDIQKLGRKYDLKDVAPGYARNFLVPRNMAEFATKQSLNNLEARRNKASRDLELQMEALSEAIGVLEGGEIVISARANQEGHLYARIKPAEVIEAIKSKYKITIPEEAIMPHENVKNTGVFSLTIGNKDKSASLSLVVESESSETSQHDEKKSDAIGRESSTGIGSPETDRESS